MPSIADSKKLVKESLDAGPNHDAILAALQDEIDKHNRVKDDAEEHLQRRKRRRERSEAKDKAGGSDLRFRFKDGIDNPSDRRARHRRSKRMPDHSTDHTDEEETTHPFPREPASPAAPPAAPPADDAFLSSLLDALADDEAAAYWESVYSQPIHAFSRPSVRTEKGELEQMNDEEYAVWVKQKMWEKQHPEILIERDRMAKKRQEEEVGRLRRRQEFVRRRERDAWTQASRHKDDGEYDYVFDFDSARNSDGAARQPKSSKAEWSDAWKAYIRGWERLRAEGSVVEVENPSKVLPWPTLPSKPPTRPHIEEFMRNMPLQDGKTRQHILKAERVRWHPDKIQQRFQGKVDEGTMKVVTGIFQIIDAIWSEEVARE